MPPKSCWKSNIHVLANLPADIYPNRGQNHADALNIATNLAVSLISAFPDTFSDEASQRIVKNVTDIWRDRDKVIRNSAMATGDEETDNDNTQTWMKAHTLTALLTRRCGKGIIYMHL